MDEAGFWFGLFLLVLAVTPSVAAWQATKNHYRSAAIERGYAYYCAQDGKFAWKGECDQ